MGSLKTMDTLKLTGEIELDTTGSDDDFENLISSI